MVEILNLKDFFRLLFVVLIHKELQVVYVCVLALLMTELYRKIGLLEVPGPEELGKMELLDRLCLISYPLPTATNHAPCGANGTNAFKAHRIAFCFQKLRFPSRCGSFSNTFCQNKWPLTPPQSIAILK